MNIRKGTLIATERRIAKSPIRFNRKERRERKEPEPGSVWVFAIFAFFAVKSPWSASAQIIVPAIASIAFARGGA